MTIRKCKVTNNDTSLIVTPPSTIPSIYKCIYNVTMTYIYEICLLVSMVSTSASRFYRKAREKFFSKKKKEIS